MTLDDLEVLAAVSVPFEVFEQLRRLNTKAMMIYCGVDGDNRHAYMLESGEYLKFDEKIEVIYKEI